MTRAEQEQDEAAAMNEQQQSVPEKTKSKMFFICANVNYVFGLDHEGYVWSKSALEVESEWKCLGKPESDRSG
jgi:hypothetical protein